MRKKVSKIRVCWPYFGKIVGILCDSGREYRALFEYVLMSWKSNCLWIKGDYLTMWI